MYSLAFPDMFSISRTKLVKDHEATSSNLLLLLNTVTRGCLYGDPYYDFAKLYYSFFGNYDQFNNKKFVLNIYESDAVLNIDSSGYEFLEKAYFKLIDDYDSKKIKFLHGLIWLSLTTYAWEDYDSICGAFYKGVMVINDAMKEFEL